MSKQARRIASGAKELAIMTNPVARAIRAVQTSDLGMFVGNLMKPASAKGDQAFKHLKQPSQGRMHPLREGRHRKR